MIAIVGAGRVGSALAFSLARKGLDELVLVDIAKGLAEGEALDMSETCVLPASLRGTPDIREIKGARVVVVAAGLARQPGMDRTDLLRSNAGTIRSISGSIKELAPDAVVIMVTNPLDAMTWVALKATGFERERVIGMGGLLDSMRMRYFISRELGISPGNVEAMVIGEHGESMVPLVSRSRVMGKPANKLLSKKQTDNIIKSTKGAGAHIVGLKGYTSWGPSEAASMMVEAVVKGGKEVMPASVLLEGEYGMDSLCIGVPVRLGKNGLMEIVELELDNSETEQLMESGKAVKKTIEALG